MRTIRRFKRTYLLVAQLYIECRDSGLEMSRLCRSNDRRCNCGPGQQPGKRHLRGRNSYLLRDFSHRVYHVHVARRIIEIHCVLIVAGASRALRRRRRCASKSSASERGPWNNTDSFRDAERHHLSLLFAINEVVVVLHRDESSPAISLGHAERLCHLPRVTRACADVPHFALLDEMIQRGESLLDRNRSFESMDLIKIDCVDAQSFQAGVTCLKNVLTREAAHVWSVTHGEVDFGGKDYLLHVRHFPQCAPRYALAHAH